MKARLDGPSLGHTSLLLAQFFSVADLLESQATWGFIIWGAGEPLLRGRLALGEKNSLRCSASCEFRSWLRLASVAKDGSARLLGLVV